MRHVEIALEKLKNGRTSETGSPQAFDFIALENTEDVKGVAPIVSFQIQSDPIGEVGVNGCQATDMLEYVKCLFESLNEAFPCDENSLTLGHIESALEYQAKRTADRESRKVEGKNEA